MVPTAWFPRGFSRCRALAHPSLVSPTAEKVSSLGKDWHKFCLKCERCNKTLTPGGHAEVRAGGPGWERGWHSGVSLSQGDNARSGAGTQGGVAMPGAGLGQVSHARGRRCPCGMQAWHDTDCCGCKRCCCCSSGCSSAQPWASHRVVLAPRVASLLCHPGLPAAVARPSKRLKLHALGRVARALHRLWRCACAQSPH